MEYTNCKWCGSRIDADAGRCDNCGKEVAPARPSLLNPPSSSTPPSPVAVKESRTRTSTAQTPQLAVVRRIRLIIVLGFLIYFGYRIYPVARMVYDEFRQKPQTQSAVTTSSNSETAKILSDLSSTDAETRYNRCQALGSMETPPPEVMTEVIKHLSDPMDNVRGSCAWAVSKYGAAAADAIPALISLLHDPSAYPRLTAAETLGTIASQVPDNTTAVPALVAALKDPDQQVRRFAAIGLKTMGPRAKSAIPALMTATHDSFGEVRSNSVEALGAMITLDPQIVSLMTVALNDKDNNVRFPAIEALGKAGALARPAIPALGRTLQNKNDDARGAAVDALGNCCKDFAETMPYFILALSDPDDSVRKFAVLHLGEMGPKAKAAVPALIPLLSGDAIFLRVWAAEALGNIGPDAKAALPRLQQMLHEKVVSNEMEAAELPGTVQTAIQKISGQTQS